MLREQNFPNTLVYLPGNKHDLYPLTSKHDEYRMFDPCQVNQFHWIWGMTPSFLHAVLYGEGFDIVHQDELSALPNENWFWGGYVYEKKRENPSHWGSAHITPGLHTGSW
jgi:hypothetical protein